MTRANEIEPPPAAQASPTPESERVETLDVLRGIALLGILLINVAAMASPADWTEVDWDELSSLDYGIEVAKVFLVEGKFYTLFSLLFGIGFALQLGRAEQKGVGFVGRYLWRMILLYLIGAVHLVLIWDGDILHTYAACGVVLLLFMGIKRLLDWLLRKVTRGRRERTPRWLLPVIAGLLIFAPMGIFGSFVYRAYQAHRTVEAGGQISASQQRLLDRMSERNSPDRVAERAERTARENVVYADGSYVDTVRYRLKNIGKRIMPNPFWLLVTCIFMIGAYIGRKRLLARAAELRTGFARLTVVSLIIGLPASGAYVWARLVTSGERYPWWDFILTLTKTVSTLALALALIGGVALAMQTGARSWLLRLAPVGRMALTNYLLQSVIGTLAFNGSGLSLHDDLGVGGQTLFALVVFAAQVWFSQRWLVRYQFGPVEWLWRSAAYLRRQPMRR